MKKYIPFQLILMMCLSDMGYVYSMEIESDQDKVCYLTILPTEVWNYIGQLVVYESEDEFIARTTREKDEIFPQEHYEYFGCKNSLGIEHVIGVFSPDKNKIALLEKNHGGCANPGACINCVASKLMIIDLEEKKEEGKILFIGTLDTRSYRTVGLSFSGNIYAVIRKERKEQEASMESQRDYHDVLVVYDRVKQKESTFLIPDSFYVSHLMFNKQGTSVIAHGRDFSGDSGQTNYVNNYMLFDLKEFYNKEKNGVDEKFVEKKKEERNCLLEYFRHYDVCQMKKIEIKEIKK